MPFTDAEMSEFALCWIGIEAIGHNTPFLKHAKVQVGIEPVAEAFNLKNACLEPSFVDFRTNRKVFLPTSYKIVFWPLLKSQAEAFRFSWPPPEKFSDDGNRVATARYSGRLGTLAFPAAPESHFESSRPSLGNIPPADKAA